MDYPTFRKTAFCRFGSVLKTSDLALAKEKTFIKQKTCRLGVYFRDDLIRAYKSLYMK